MHESESKVTQSCLTLSDPMDCSLSGSSVHGIFQARVLEWIAMSNFQLIKDLLYFFLILNIAIAFLAFLEAFILALIGISCRKIPWRRKWQSTPVLLPGKSHAQRSLVGCSPWGRWGSDTTEQLHFHFLLSCIGEGNGNPLQCSCLENPRERGAWWAAVYGVAQSRTQLKWLSSKLSRIGLRVLLL